MAGKRRSRRPQDIDVQGRSGREVDRMTSTEGAREDQNEHDQNRLGRSGAAYDAAWAVEHAVDELREAYAELVLNLERARVAILESMSAHADSNEIMRWLSHFSTPPGLTCLVHGEPEPMDALKARIEQELGWRVATPVAIGSIALEPMVPTLDDAENPELVDFRHRFWWTLPLTIRVTRFAMESVISESPLIRGWL